MMLCLESTKSSAKHTQNTVLTNVLIFSNAQPSDMCVQIQAYERNKD